MFIKMLRSTHFCRKNKINTFSIEKSYNPQNFQWKIMPSTKFSMKNNVFNKMFVEKTYDPQN